MLRRGMRMMALPGSTTWAARVGVGQPRSSASVAFPLPKQVAPVAPPLPDTVLLQICLKVIDLLPPVDLMSLLWSMWIVAKPTTWPAWLQLPIEHDGDDEQWM